MPVDKQAEVEAFIKTLSVGDDANAIETMSDRCVEISPPEIDFEHLLRSFSTPSTEFIRVNNTLGFDGGKSIKGGNIAIKYNMIADMMSDGLGAATANGIAATLAGTLATEARHQGNRADGDRGH